MCVREGKNHGHVKKKRKSSQPEVSRWESFAHIPFVIVRPDVHSLPADILRLEKRERRLRRGYLYGYILVLEQSGREVSQREEVWVNLEKPCHP